MVDLIFFSNIHTIQFCFIGLPNGFNTIENFEENVKLGSELIIHNILYMSNLVCMLISISQLLHFYPEYDVYFSKNMCYTSSYSEKGDKTWSVQVHTLVDWHMECTNFHSTG